MFKSGKCCRPIQGDQEKSVNLFRHGSAAVVTRYGFAIAKIDLKIKVISFQYLTVRVTTEGASSIVATVRIVLIQSG